MATSVPTAQNRVFWGVNTTFFISSGAVGSASGVKYTAVSDIGVKYGYKLYREGVTGQNAPYIGTGMFEGEVQIRSLASSDSRFETLITATSGTVQTWNVMWNETDTQSTQSGRSWTVSGVKFFDYENINNQDKVVEFKVKGYFPSEPTVS